METKGNPGRTARLDWVTRYRGFLISAVIMVHVGITYGATGSWYFTEEHDVFWVKIAGTLVGTLTQSFAMQAFFFISAYFLAAQARRKGIRSLIEDKLLRLGVPFLFYFFVLSTVTVLAAENLGRGAGLPFALHTGSGPLWFVEALLIFTLAWALYARLRPAAIEAVPEPGLGAASRPRAGAIIACIVLAAAAGFAVRLVFPIGRSVSNLQLGFFPMYIAFFAIGAAAGRRSWLDGIEKTRVGGWAAGAAVLTVAFPVIILTGGAGKGATPFLGGLTWQSAVFAAWEAATGTSLLIVTIVLFARRSGGARGPFLRYAESSFGVYQFHAPVIVVAAALMKGLPFHPALKYLALALVGALVPWGLTELLRLVRPFRKFL